ncbi:type III-B CRISPR module-associated protein Cmr3 [Cereibacter azotoformans]|nr:hypothetical protein [Cereibacter azotoformans]MBO4170053.1 hypothetical protein [Cereibacter azotoformans]UIJ30649.1 type III-B CRISPR module-associated protein Cmr3 [Cereibacter azotoformans]
MLKHHREATLPAGPVDRQGLAVGGKPGTRIAKVDTTEVLSPGNETLNPFEVEIDPPVDVAIGEARDPGHLGERQVIAEHIQDEAVLVGALVPPSRLSDREGLAAAFATPTRIPALRLAEALIHPGMGSDRKAVVRAVGVATGRSGWVSRTDSPQPLDLLGNCAVVLQPMGCPATVALVILLVLLAGNGTTRNSGQSWFGTIGALERVR